VPRRPPLGPLALVLAVACSSGGATTASDAVPVTPVNGLSAATLLSCGDLKGQLPRELASGVSKRPTVPDSSTTTAYGADPPISVRCGLPPGSAADEPYVFDGVRWAMHDSGASRTWTTRGLKVNVAVVVPDHFQAQAELLAAMAQPITSALSR
jgi:hypothetical protein